MTQGYKSPPVGHEISAVMFGVDTKYLLDSGFLHKILIDGLKLEGFTILKEIVHDFEPQGFTSLVLLSESHASIHTYPEHNTLYFQIYSCRGPGDGRKTFEHMKNMLKPKFVEFDERSIVVDRTVDVKNKTIKIKQKR